MRPTPSTLMLSAPSLYIKQRHTGQLCVLARDSAFFNLAIAVPGDSWDRAPLIPLCNISFSNQHFRLPSCLSVLSELTSIQYSAMMPLCQVETWLSLSIRSQWSTNIINWAKRSRFLAEKSHGIGPALFLCCFLSQRSNSFYVYYPSPYGNPFYAVLTLIYALSSV
jgi:hypothetical protein